MIEKAKWITWNDVSYWELNESNYNKSSLLRKEFKAEKPISKVTLEICALGLGVCTVNGKNVTDSVLTTPFTRYDKRVIYNVYDITNLVNTGDNAIGIHIGNGFYRGNMVTWNEKGASWRDIPKAAAAIIIEYTDNTTDTVLTDKSWKGNVGPCIYNQIRQGEYYDARLEQNGYDMPNFDDSSWDSAMQANEPGGILETTTCPPIKVDRVIKPVSVTGNIYDFGESISGRARIKLTGKSGQKVRLTFDDRFPEKDMERDAARFIAYNNLPSDLKHENVFICSGEEKEEYAPSFCYYGFRYITVENAPDDFEISAEFIHTDLKQIGSFTCCDEMINKIHKATMNSVLSNYFGMPTDCPQREQNGWTGDAHATVETRLLNFDMTDAHQKWLKDFKDAQRPSGQIPGVIPGADWGFNWGCGPTWDSALILIPWQEYIHTGNDSLIRLMWENIKLYMGYMERMSSGYTVSYGTFLGDWCQVKGSKLIPQEAIDTAYFHTDCLVVAKMAKLLKEDYTKWENLASNIKKVWREKFYFNPELSDVQTLYSAAVYHGFLNDDEIPSAAEKLAKMIENNDFHIDCGMFGTKYAFSTLSENGYMDTVYKMITNPTYPSYAYWILSGATSLMEFWDMTQSWNHHMFGSVDEWFYRYVGGIKFTEDGLIINPVLTDYIPEFKVTHRKITVERKHDKLFVTLDRDAKFILSDKTQNLGAGKYEFKIN